MSSIRATNLALASGMHHCSFHHGLSVVFFEHPPDRGIGDGLDEASLHQAIGQ
jgi:hypothetical protein